jgi:iron complex outermembrane receptor protein
MIVTNHLNVRRDSMRSGLLGAVACLALVPAQAWAQTVAPPQPATATPDEDEPATQADIVVTATRQGQTVQDAPISVSVIDETLIEGSGATNFSEVATLIPSVVFSQQQSPIQSNVGIRGVTTAGGSAALEPSVGIYVDGVFTDRTSVGIGDFNDIERIEVLRGPQGTLFGNSSPAGVINFVTKRPSQTFGADVEATVGNFNRVQLAGSITGPIASDKLSFRVSAFSHERDGYLKNLAGPDVNDQNSRGVRAKLLFEPTPDIDLVLTAEHGKTDSVCCAPVIDNVSQATLDRFAIASQQFPFRGSGVPFPTNQLNGQVVAIDGASKFKSKNDAIYLDASWDLGAIRLSSISAYRRFATFGRQDLDFTALNLLDFPEVTREQDQVSQEVRLSSTGKQALSYLFGAYYFEKNALENTARGLVINPDLVARVPTILAATTPSGSDIRNRNYAVFGELGYAITDQLRVTGGLRYNYDKKNITAFASRLRANGTPLSPTQTIPEAFQNRKGGELTGRAIIEYDFTRSIQSYASYTRGYKAFGINDDANLLRNIPGASFFFDSEKVDNYEVGLKTYFPAQRLTANIVLFNTVYSDFQSLSSFTDTNNQLRFFLQNAASLTSRGAEIDLSWKPSRRFFAQASATLLDATFDSFPNAESPTGPRDLSGEPLRDAPKVSTSLVAQYTQPLTRTIEAFVRGDVFYRSAVFTNQNLDPLERQEAYTKINGRVGIGQADGRWSLELFVRNLTDEITFGRAGVPTFGAFNAVLGAVGSAAIPVGSARLKFVGEPRTFGVTGRFRF